MLFHLSHVVTADLALQVSALASPTAAALRSGGAFAVGSPGGGLPNGLPTGGLDSGYVSPTRSTSFGGYNVTHQVRSCHSL